MIFAALLMCLCPFVQANPYGGSAMASPPQYTYIRCTGGTKNTHVCLKKSGASEKTTQNGNKIDTCEDHYAKWFGTTWCYFGGDAHYHYDKYEACCKKEGGGFETKMDTQIGAF